MENVFEFVEVLRNKKDKITKYHLQVTGIEFIGHFIAVYKPDQTWSIINYGVNRNDPNPKTLNFTHKQNVDEDVVVALYKWGLDNIAKQN